MLTLRTLAQRALILILLISPGAAVAQAPPSDTVEYRAREGDNLWLIAMMFYGTPRAFPPLVDANVEDMTTIWENHVAADPALRAQYPRPADFLTLDQVVLLPREMSAAGVLLQRLPSPMSRAIARRLGRYVDLTILAALSKEMGLDQDAPPTYVPLPFVPVRTGAPARRDARGLPPWWGSPDSVLQRCAVTVCQRYPALAPPDCLIVARRMSDAGWSETEVAARCSHWLPAELPLEIEVSHAN